MKKGKYYIISGGTVEHVAPHFALCAPAYGTIGTSLCKRLSSWNIPYVHLRTRMAGEPSAVQKRVLQEAELEHLETNSDLSKLVNYLISLPDTRCIVMAAAVCDFEPVHLDDGADILPVPGKSGQRLQSGVVFDLRVKTADKIINRIRRERKDIFLVAFKATTYGDADESYRRGLRLLKQNSANLVFVNDITHKQNMIVTPEEFRYTYEDRNQAVRDLASMIVHRTNLNFVRTRVIDEPLADVEELDRQGAIPSNFLPVLRWLISKNAYKPFLDKTAGHFGCKVTGMPYTGISSVRKVDHNNVFNHGMVKIYGQEDSKILAGGAKPSVGEHTQQEIYRMFPRARSIVHFHCPLREGSLIPVASQRPFECGSVECGRNTSMKMQMTTEGIWAVHLDGHGPNIAFDEHTPPEAVQAFIEEHWDLSDKTGGVL